MKTNQSNFVQRQSLSDPFPFGIKCTAGEKEREAKFIGLGNNKVILLSQAKQGSLLLLLNYNELGSLLFLKFLTAL